MSAEIRVLLLGLIRSFTPALNQSSVPIVWAKCTPNTATSVSEDAITILDTISAAWKAWGSIRVYASSWLLVSLCIQEAFQFFTHIAWPLFGKPLPMTRIFQLEVMTLTYQLNSYLENWHGQSYSLDYICICPFALVMGWKDYEFWLLAPCHLSFYVNVPLSLLNLEHRTDQTKDIALSPLLWIDSVLH